MDDIVIAISAVIIFLSGYGLGYMTGGIANKNKCKKEELEKRFKMSVQNIIDKESEEV